MGDRASILIKTDSESFTIYSHWGGYSYAKELASVLEATRDVWDDDGYLLTNFLRNYFPKDNVAVYHGNVDCGHEHPLLTVDFEKKTIEVGGLEFGSSNFTGKKYTFKEFMAAKKDWNVLQGTEDSADEDD